MDHTAPSTTICLPHRPYRFPSFIFIFLKSRVYIYTYLHLSVSSISSELPYPFPLFLPYCHRLLSQLPPAHFPHISHFPDKNISQKQNGSYGRLTLCASMALADIWAMCWKSNSSASSSLGSTIKKKDSSTQTGGMEFESDWTKHRKSSAFTAQAIRSATSFMPWSCKISRSEGFHEYL